MAQAKKNAGTAIPATGAELGARNISNVNLSVRLDCDPDVSSLTKNPGAAATATGVSTIGEASQLPDKGSTSWRAKAIKAHAKPAHKAAARMVGYALTIRNDYGSQTAAFVFRHRLNPEDRAILATAILDSLTDREFAGVIRHFCGEGAT